ncbi:unnamed protein product [Meloidogyne enterolobii]|uniref:Uncharacterized protein n=1 Tax=Meloidogyne enterolobii TaxID=390850 RepID=A0ACB0YER1_MELEN
MLSYRLLKFNTIIKLIVDQGDKCQLPIEPGGTAQLPRFGYEPSTQQCHQFIYRGLKGNQNNFLTLEECQLACLPNPCPSGKNLVGIRTHSIFLSSVFFDISVNIAEMRYRIHTKK